MPGGIGGIILRNALPCSEKFCSCLLLKETAVTANYIKRQGLVG